MKQKNKSGPLDPRTVTKEMWQACRNCQLKQQTLQDAPLAAGMLAQHGT
jgi:hypothetical protein